MYPLCFKVSFASNYCRGESHNRHLYKENSCLRKPQTFCDSTSGFPAKKRRREKMRRGRRALGKALGTRLSPEEERGFISRTAACNRAYGLGKLCIPLENSSKQIKMLAFNDTYSLWLTKNNCRPMTYGHKCRLRPVPGESIFLPREFNTSQPEVDFLQNSALVSPKFVGKSSLKLQRHYALRMW